MYDEEEKYSILYQQLIFEMMGFHRSNQARLRKGLRSLLIVPLIFMILLFLTEGSRVIFLTLWIVSMFCIAAYLIAIEYMDNEMQKRLRQITELEEHELDEILASDDEAPRRAMHEHLQWLKTEIRAMQAGRGRDKEGGRG